MKRETLLKKDTKELKKVAQRAFNKWIRERDGFNCLACGRYSEKMDASHYASQGSSGYLRYHPYNVNNTCWSCNRFKGGNIISYRQGLIGKIGEDNVRWIEENRHKLHKYTNEQLVDIIEYCKHNTMNVLCWNEIMSKV